MKDVQRKKNMEPSTRASIVTTKPILLQDFRMFKDAEIIPIEGNTDAESIARDKEGEDWECRMPDGDVFSVAMRVRWEEKRWPLTSATLRHSNPYTGLPLCEFETKMEKVLAGREPTRWEVQSLFEKVDGYKSNILRCVMAIQTVPLYIAIHALQTMYARKNLGEPFPVWRVEEDEDEDRWLIRIDNWGVLTAVERVPIHLWVPERGYYMFNDLVRDKWSRDDG